MQPSSQAASRAKTRESVVYLVLDFGFRCLASTGLGLDGAMARAITNVVNGEFVPAASGATYDVIDPSTGAGVRHGAPVAEPRTSTVPSARRRRRSRRWRDTTPNERLGDAAPVRRARSRSGPRSSWTSSRATPASPWAHDERGDPRTGARRRDVLRRRRAGARGQVGRGVHARPHLDDPARADRRRRPGDAVELPAR